MLLHRLQRPMATLTATTLRRALSTLQGNPHIYIFPSSNNSHILTLLPTNPPNSNLAIGTTAAIPPTPDSLRENPHFLRIMHSVIKEHATRDPYVISQAQAMASAGGSALGSGGVFFPQQQQVHQRNRRRQSYGGGGGAGGDGAGGASSQGGAGGAGRGGWIHVSDQRNAPDYGRIAWPEDIFGSLEVDGHGDFVGENGSYQESGTYRIITREGMQVAFPGCTRLVLTRNHSLGLSPYLREKLVERLRKIEREN
ncbi:hypothetical protein BJ546DRAFT_10496 [Cryomyces antarcticus]|nr:hypothetical protein LTR39_003855 [Cryomyces antarcticus]